MAHKEIDIKHPARVAHIEIEIKHPLQGLAKPASRKLQKHWDIQ